MRKTAGFTLIELLTTMVVVGILVSMAIPNFKLTIQNNRLVTESNDLLGALIYARSEAVTIAASQGHPVIICASSDGATCSASTNWQNGWIVTGYTAAASATSNVSGTSTNTVLRVYPAFGNTNTLNGAAIGSSISFFSNGTASLGDASFILCDSRGKTFGRSIYLYKSGEARIAPTAGQLLSGTSISAC